VIRVSNVKQVKPQAGILPNQAVQLHGFAVGDVMRISLQDARVYLHEHAAPFRARAEPVHHIILERFHIGVRAVFADNHSIKSVLGGKARHFVEV